METKHDNFETVTPVGPLEKARLDKIVRALGRQVDASVCQAVAEREGETQVEQKGGKLGPLAPAPGWVARHKC